jgi:hypothetical protein
MNCTYQGKTVFFALMVLARKCKKSFILNHTLYFRTVILFIWPQTKDFKMY